MMNRTEPSPATDWMEAVSAIRGSMTQRKLATIERWFGGLPALVEAARARGVYLLQLSDDHGETLIAASTSPFKPLTWKRLPVRASAPRVGRHEGPFDLGRVADVEVVVVTQVAAGESRRRGRGSAGHLAQGRDDRC